ncbi:hypothetical protein JIN85_14800 [Luteolibacter pohnpeiensis]|uniref:Uncharacterized protein n=1 Tax=Luteolibacter pohnpeiensis TaxID=454153 RepID=A0A934VXP0_9BACT|nr:hypothetical protein [Luteolibacter pohnpeiensis]MBK1883684.1 hypothetical protein [Luteolibacter pohnpeiensis]
MSTGSKTPETDAIADSLTPKWIQYSPMTKDLLDHGRKLERERNELRQILDEISKRADEANEDSVWKDIGWITSTAHNAVMHQQRGHGKNHE